MLSVIDHKPGNLTLRVSGDSQLLDIQGYLKGYNQFLPVGPLWKDVTISQAIENNLFGTYCEHYGLMKNLLLNLKLETGRGIIQTGADVMKNVSGYDLTRLTIGAKGSLGKILEATFRIYPIRVNFPVFYDAIPSPSDSGTRLNLPVHKASLISDILTKNQVSHQHYAALGVIDLDISMEELGSELVGAVEKINGTIGLLKYGIFTSLDNPHHRLQKQIKSVFDPDGIFPDFNG